MHELVSQSEVASQRETQWMKVKTGGRGVFLLTEFRLPETRPISWCKTVWDKHAQEEYTVFPQERNYQAQSLHG